MLVDLPDDMVLYPNDVQNLAIMQLHGKDGEGRDIYTYHGFIDILNEEVEGFIPAYDDDAVS